MKTDQYLNLCLEQAALSPLNYRHGCVVVKGGKVIGQGYNDYRPGYDGGSVLKTGILPKAACAFESCDPDEPDPPMSKGSSPPPVCGGGHHANERLSMHSEMMAINSALASSNTLAASTVPNRRQCFKLPGDTKRKRALRREHISAYVQAACLKTFGQELQQGTGKAQADEWRFEPSTYRFDSLLSEDKDERWSTTTTTKSTSTSTSTPSVSESHSSLSETEASLQTLSGVLPGGAWVRVQDCC